MCPNKRLQTPTFAQTIVLIQTMPAADQGDKEAIIKRHLAHGFSYDNQQILRARKAIHDPARPWSHTRRRSARST